MLESKTGLGLLIVLYTCTIPPSNRFWSTEFIPFAVGVRNLFRSKRNKFRTPKPITITQALFYDDAFF